jgi:carbamoyltransferase
MLDGNRLVFSVEIEKLANNPRYGEVEDLRIVGDLLGDFGYRPSDVDAWVIDGWDGVRSGHVRLRNDGSPVELTLAPYRENDEIVNLLTPGRRDEFPIGRARLPFTSYVHVASHLASAYATSPFARDGEPSAVLIWDGGTFPRLYHVEPQGGVTNGGELFPLIGHAYAMSAHHFGPFRRAAESEALDDLSVAGKLMAYIALGTVRPDVIQILATEFARHFEADTPEVALYRRTIVGCGSHAEPSHRYVHNFFRDVRRRTEAIGASDEDVLASVHQFLEDLLVDRVTAKLRAWRGDGPWNLCFAGGCALNIKWNSALRSAKGFRSVWVPPFPNDTGSALGAAALHLAATDGFVPLRWDARLGPHLRQSAALPGWASTPCTPEQLAAVLRESGEPVVLLHGRAELGPRALGGRSILAPAVDPAMRDTLNRIKDREPYRPVAPVCLVEHAPDIFDPGTPDPHMLFDHRVRPEWVDRIPAVLHLDGTARLQTVSAQDDPTLERILREYHRLTGIPVLCNTSANHHGRGFFPDVASAQEWGRVDRVWSDDILYHRAEQR